LGWSNHLRAEIVEQKLYWYLTDSKYEYDGEVLYPTFQVL